MPISPDPKPSWTTADGKRPKISRGVLLSANFGSYDKEFPWPQQNHAMLSREGRARLSGEGTTWLEQIDFSIERYNDKNFPARALALTPRLKPALIKMFGWQFYPHYHYYIWVDASKTLRSPDFASYMVQQLGAAEFAVFRHPERHSVREEYEFVSQKMAEGNRYLLDRYSGEFLDAQWSAIYRDRHFPDEVLYASTSFIYRPRRRVRKALKEWWYHKTRFLLHDQLALPYVLWQYGVKVNVIEENIYKFPFWEHSRKAKRR